MDNQTANPNVFVNEIEQNVPKPARKFFSFKIIFIILGIIVVIELIFGVRSLFQGSSPIPTGAKIILESAKQSAAVGEVVPVTVKIDTAKKSTDGVDLILHFDPKVLELKESDITPGTIYPDFPLRNVDQSAGIIRVSAIASLSGQGFSGEGVLVTLQFSAKASGKSAISVEFSEGQTADSNIVESGVGMDLLKEVKNLEVTIK